MLVPVVTATCGFAATFRHFCSRDAVEKWNRPSCHTPTIGATWGRPSERTDVNQYSSASASARSTSTHRAGSAAGSL